MPSYMPYIEGPTMDWMITDGLYNRFLKWCLKCENILECEPVSVIRIKKMQEGVGMEW